MVLLKETEAFFVVKEVSIGCQDVCLRCDPPQERLTGKVPASSSVALFKAVTANANVRPKCSRGMQKMSIC